MRRLIETHKRRGRFENGGVQKSRGGAAAVRREGGGDARVVPGQNEGERRFVAADTRREERVRRVRFRGEVFESVFGKRGDISFGEERRTLLFVLGKYFFREPESDASND